MQKFFAFFPNTFYPKLSVIFKYFHNRIYILNFNPPTIEDYKINYEGGEKHMTADGYTAVYDSGETSEVSIDLIVAVGAGLVSFATLIALVLLFGFLKKRLPRI